MKKILVLSFLIVSPVISLAVHPVSTFSIVGCDTSTGELGVAVASKYFAVGAIVPWAKAGVGAVATQSYVNPDYGINGMDLLESGLSPKEVIDSLTSADSMFAKRQAGIINSKARLFPIPGKNVLPGPGTSWKELRGAGEYPGFGRCCRADDRGV